MRGSTTTQIHEIVTSIEDVVSQSYEGEISFEEFRDRSKALWKQAEELGIKAEVSQMLQKHLLHGMQEAINGLKKANDT